MKSIAFAILIFGSQIEWAIEKYKEPEKKMDNGTGFWFLFVIIGFIISLGF